jgi:hypothetical protein
MSVTKSIITNVFALKSTIGMKTYSEVLQEILGLGIDVQLTALSVDSEVKGRDLGNVLILALSLLFLELEGDTTDRTALDTLHQMGRVPGNLFKQDPVRNMLIHAGRVLEHLVLCSVLTLLRRRFEAMIAISSQILLLVSKSRVNLG